MRSILGTLAPARNALSQAYAPQLHINMNGSTGNPHLNASYASMVAKAVSQALDQHRPNTFERSDHQQLAALAGKLERIAAARNG